MRALLMELAHPLIAAGVADHSDFRKRPFKRLYRTMRLMSCITFGSRKAASRAAQRIGQCHSSVQGELRQPAGCHPSGCAYNANDPQLKLWVLATLIDSSLCLYELFMRPLSAEEKESYYQDSRRMGLLLGIDPASMPADYRRLFRLSSNDAIRENSCSQRPGARSGRRPARWPVAGTDRARRQLRQHWAASEGSSCGLRSLME